MAVRLLALLTAALLLGLAAPAALPALVPDARAQAAPVRVVPGPLAPRVAAAPACPAAATPGPPVNASEAPAPGDAPPAPLPLPDPPVGGEALGTCGVVVPPGAPAPPEVVSQSYVVADLDSGAVLAAKAPHARLRPASLLKTLTGLLAARLPMDEVITGTQEDANQDGTRVGIGAGGRYTVRQLLDAMLMASGNDAAHALAVRLTGSPGSTVALMNRTAAGIGALDTRAATPSGLDGPGQQSSAYDLASIYRIGLREPEFARATATRRIDFPGYGAIPGFVVANDNRLFTTYPGVIGGKTGFTDDARHTYLGAAERGGRRLVVVLMRGEQRPVRMVEQAAALLDYGFARPGDTGSGDAQRVGTLTEAPAGEPTVAPDGIVAPATLDPVPAARGASGETSVSHWGTPLALAAVVVLVLLVAALRVRRG